VIPITTYTGKKVDPTNLDPKSVCIEDIAHALACINRFNGHAKIPISVAQHSVDVSNLSTPYRLEGLLHDAAEAYLGDMTKWLKSSPGMEEYRNYEEHATNVICKVFGIDPELPDIVKWADNLTVRFEHEIAFGMPQSVKGYGQLTKNERLRLDNWRPMSWQDAEVTFLMTYHDILRR